jgi:hypothetical protein
MGRRVAALTRTAILSTGLVLVGCCVDEKQQETISPDCRYVARILWGNCGATTAYDPYLQVIDRQAVWPWRFKKEWSLGVKAYERRLRWLGPDALAVEYPPDVPPSQQEWYFLHGEWGNLQIALLEARSSFRVSDPSPRRLSPSLGQNELSRCLGLMR